MPSVESVLIVDFFRRGWMGILAAVLVMIALPVTVLSGIWRIVGFPPASDAVVAMHVVFTLMTGFLAACAVFVTEGSLARFYTRPISIRRLVAWQMLLGVVTIAAMYLASATIINLGGYAWPLWGPALFLATAFACSQAAIWTLEGSSVGQLLGCLGTLIPFVTWFRRQYGELHSGATLEMWNGPSAVQILLLGAIICAAYGVTVAGVNRTRRGDMLNFSRLLAWWEARLARRHTPPAPFVSPLAAQFWSDWRQKFAAAPAVIMGGFAVSILGARMTGYQTTVDMLDLMFVLPLVLQATLLPVLFGLVIGSSAARNRVTGMSQNLATRPVPDAVLATSLLRTGALSMFLSWGVWIGGLLVAAGVAFLTGDKEATDKATFLFPLWQNAMVVAWILVISWALVGCMASLVAIGRPWIWISVISTICILALACVWGVLWSSRHGTDALTVVFTLGIPFLLLLLAGSLFVVARRKRLIGEVVTWLSIIGWLGALAALIVALHIPPQSWLFGIAIMIYFGGFLAIPFMPLAGMPLAIHYNRHR